jgi:hypothetical protein
MTYPGQGSPINTADDILKSGYDIENNDYGGVAHVAFEATQNTLYQEIWRKKSLVKSVGPSVEKVIQGDTVFIDFLSALTPNTKAVYKSEAGLDTVHIGKNFFFSFSLGWAYQPGGIFQDVFEESVLLFYLSDNRKNGKKMQFLN